MPIPAGGAAAAMLLDLQRTIGNRAVYGLLQRVPMKAALKKALRRADGWSEADVDDESLEAFCAKCTTERQATLIAETVEYAEWSDFLADRTPGDIPASKEDLRELVEQEKVRRKNIELRSAASRPQPKEPEFDRAGHIDRRVPSTELASRLQAQDLLWAQLSETEQRALIVADADVLSAPKPGKVAARSALDERVREIKLDRQRSAEHAATLERRRATAELATQRMRATPAGDPFGNALFARIWHKAVDSYTTGNANVTVDGEYAPTEIRGARDEWRRVRNRGNAVGVTNLHVPGGEQFIEDKGPKDVSRGASAREARWYQADFVSSWNGFAVNVHVDATGPLPA